MNKKDDDHSTQAPQKQVGYVVYNELHHFPMHLPRVYVYDYCTC